MNVYMILFVPRCSDAEHYLDDTFSSHIVANSESNAIKQFLEKGLNASDPIVINFLLSFIGEGLKSSPRNNRVFDDKMRVISSIAHSQNIFDYDLEDPIVVDFLNKNFDDLVYLLFNQAGPWFRVEKVENINTVTKLFYRF